MTDADLHLDDETISAALDGEPIDAAAQAHLDGCAVCRARLDVFSRVAAAVAAPVAPPDADARDAAIAAAVGAPEPARRNWAPLLAVAAVILVLALAVPLIGALSSGDGGRDDAATSGPAAGAGGGATEQATAAVPDLGPVSADSLRPLVEAQLGGSPKALTSPAPAAAPGDAGSSADSGASSTATTAPALSADAAAACEPSVHADGSRVLLAQATWDGTPAAVLAYRAGDDVRVYVVDPAGCRILHFVRFRAES